MLSKTQAGPGRAVKQEQEQNSRNHVQAFLLVSVQYVDQVQGSGIIFEGYKKNEGPLQKIKLHLLYSKVI